MCDKKTYTIRQNEANNHNIELMVQVLNPYILRQNHGKALLRFISTISSHLPPRECSCKLVGPTKCRILAGALS